MDATKHELTYVVGDEDKTLKLSDTANFISNNEWIGVSTAAAPYESTFYPSAARMWLPISYKFIDNDKDGKYDFAIRNTYGFTKVVNMTSSKLQLDGQASIDRKDDAGDAYAWDASLADIAVDNYVFIMQTVQLHWVQIQALLPHCIRYTQRKLYKDCKTDSTLESIMTVTVRT